MRWTSPDCLGKSVGACCPLCICACVIRVGGTGTDLCTKRFESQRWLTFGFTCNPVTRARSICKNFILNVQSFRFFRAGEDAEHHASPFVYKPVFCLRSIKRRGERSNKCTRKGGFLMLITIPTHPQLCLTRSPEDPMMGICPPRTWVVTDGMWRFKDGQKWNIV